MQDITIHIPCSVFESGGMDTQEIQALAQRMTALGLYVEHGVSLGTCSHIAGMPETEFMQFMSAFGASVFRFDSLSEIEEDYHRA